MGVTSERGTQGRKSEGKSTIIHQHQAMLWQICVKYAGTRGGDLGLFSVSPLHVAGGGKLLILEYFNPVSCLFFFSRLLCWLSTISPPLSPARSWILGHLWTAPASACLTRTKHLYPSHSLLFSPSSLGMPDPHPGPYLQHIKMHPGLWHLCALPCLEVRGCACLGWLHERCTKELERSYFSAKPLLSFIPLVFKQKFSLCCCQENIAYYHVEKSPSPDALLLISSRKGSLM